jgi:hypothetical protein
MLDRSPKFSSILLRQQIGRRINDPDHLFSKLNLMVVPFFGLVMILKFACFRRAFFHNPDSHSFAFIDGSLVEPLPVVADLQDQLF